jgi:hypothetical protein
MENLQQRILKRASVELNLNGDTEMMNEAVVSEPLGLAPVNSVFMFTTIVEETATSTDIYRILAVFEPKGQSIFDKLVGRSGFYGLTSLTYVWVPFADNILPKRILVEDYDTDGSKELFVEIESIFADRVSVGFMMLSKGEDGEWELLALPSLSQVTSETLEGLLPHPAGLKPILEPYTYFGLTEDETDPDQEKPDLSQYEVYEEEWVAVHNGAEVQFATLSNGGQYYLRRHPIKDHFQIATLGFFADEYSVLGAHYCVIACFSLETSELTRDLLWNWGYPMLSVAPMYVSDIDLDSVMQAGIDAHINGETFFGYTEFSRF